MPQPREPDFQDDLSPGTKDPVEGPRGPTDARRPSRNDPAHPPGHLGPAGDPAEGKR